TSVRANLRLFGVQRHRPSGTRPTIRGIMLLTEDADRVGELMDVAKNRDLEGFIVRAKQATYVGGGKKLLPYHLGYQDLQYEAGDWIYHDSYLGESNFIGQELVYYRREPVWGMNYFGYILKSDRITASQAGQVIMASLTRLYQKGRF